MDSNPFDRLTDARHGGAFKEATEEYLALPEELRADYEARFEKSFGPGFLSEWRAWRARQDNP